MMRDCVERLKDDQPRQVRRYRLSLGTVYNFGPRLNARLGERSLHVPPMHLLQCDGKHANFPESHTLPHLN